MQLEEHECARNIDFYRVHNLNCEISSNEDTLQNTELTHERSEFSQQQFGR